MPKTNRAAFGAAAALWLLVTSCASDDASAPDRVALSNLQPTRWVANEPTQCLTNPWEQDWLGQGGVYENYPKDPARPGLEPEEVEIIVDYYARQGVVVGDATTRPKYEEVCLACNCAEGHTLYLRVREEDIDTMIALGYRVEMPLNK
jgi:hypothetical protein